MKGGTSSRTTYYYVFKTASIVFVYSEKRLQIWLQVIKGLNAKISIPFFQIMKLSV